MEEAITNIIKYLKIECLVLTKSKKGQKNIKNGPMDSPYTLESDNNL
jgi:hypothetical protein